MNGAGDASAEESVNSARIAEKIKLLDRMLKMQDVIILGEHKFSRTRLRARAQGGPYKVSSNRNKMILFFTNPEQKVQIEGAASVSAALMELEFVLDDSDEWE